MHPQPDWSSYASEQNKDDLVYHMTAHLRMNAIYWGLTALCVMDYKDALNREEMIEFVMSCWDEQAGLFGCVPYLFSLTDEYCRRVRGTPRS